MRILLSRAICGRLDFRLRGGYTSIFPRHTLYMKKLLPAPTKSSAAAIPHSKADAELAWRLFGKLRLTYRHGMLCELRENGEAVETMNLPDIAITAKLGYELKVEGTVEYSFALSQATDLPWRTIFLDLFPRPRVEFQDAKLKVTCAPKEIAAVLKKLVETMAKVNERYDATWEAVKHLAMEQDAVHERKRADEEARAREISESFEKLVIPPVVSPGLGKSA